MADNKTSEAPRALPKSTVFKEVAAKAGLEPKQVAAVFTALEELIKEQLTGKKSPGEFVIPGLIKLKMVKKPATKAGQRSVAGRMVEVKAKPASSKVKAVTLKLLKELSK